MGFSRKDSTVNNVTFIEFSLTDETREELKAALQPYVKQEKSAASGVLGQIIAPILGEHIISTLSELKKPDPFSKTVYIIHNLPEVNKEEFIRIMKGDVLAQKSPFKSTTSYPTLYNHYLMKALEDILRSKRLSNYQLARTPADPHIISEFYHNHLRDHEVTTICGVASDDEPPTQFTNLLIAAKEAAEHDKASFDHQVCDFVKQLPQMLPNNSPERIEAFKAIEKLLGCEPPLTTDTTEISAFADVIRQKYNTLDKMNNFLRDLREQLHLDNPLQFFATEGDVAYRFLEHYADRGVWLRHLKFERSDVSVASQKILDNNSRELVIRGNHMVDGKPQGADLVMWTEDGALLHMALPAKAQNEVHSADEVTRAISVYGMERCQSI